MDKTSTKYRYNMSDDINAHRPELLGGSGSIVRLSNLIGSSENNVNKGEEAHSKMKLRD